MELSDNITPTNYKLYFNINIQELKLYGKTIIEVKITQKTDKIVLNSKDLTINNLLINNDKFDFSENTTDETITINGSFDTGNYTLIIEYTHIIGIDMDGLYYVKQDDSIIFSTQLEPIYARKLFPCFDIPKFKSLFSITIESNKDKTFLSNMPELSSKITNDNKIVEFEPTPLMSTYLVCIVIGDLKKGIPCSVNEKLTVNGYYFDKSTNLLNDSIKTTALSIKYYEKLFGIEYKLPKLDIIAIPNFLSGAMENWGLVTFRESGLMVDNTENISSLINSIEVIYHEISHQWFGNLVTLNSWKNIWLNEATATYFSWLGLIDNYKHLYPKQWYYLTTYRPAMLIDGFESTHPISTEIKSSNDVIQFFDEISYSKGSCLINYLSEFMGRNNFMMGISEYLKKYSWKTAEPEDLYSMLELYTKNKNHSVSNLMKDFIFVKGYPLITVSKNNNKYKITKSKILFIKSNTIHDFNLNFPLKIKIYKNDKLLTQLVEINDEIIMDDEPIINEDNMILCMINYENYEPNIRRMNVQELMHHIDCVYYLSISGYKDLSSFIKLNIDIFNMMDFTSNLDSTMCLFHLLIKNILTINYKLKSSNVQTLFKVDYDKFINKIKAKVNNILIYIINNKNKDIVTISWFIDLIEFLSEFKDDTLAKLLIKMFNFFYLNNESTKFNNFPLHEVLFKSVIKYNDSSEIREKINKIKDETSNIFIRNSATWALTNSQNTEYLDSLMKNIFNFVKLQDIATLIFHLSRNLLIQKKVIDWIFTTIKTDSNITYKNFAHIIERITPNIYDLELINKLKTFYEKENDTSIYAIELDKINWHISIIKNISNYNK